MYLYGWIRGIVSLHTLPHIKCTASPKGDSYQKPRQSWIGGVFLSAWLHLSVVCGLFFAMVVPMVSVIVVMAVPGPHFAIFAVALTVFRAPATPAAHYHLYAENNEEQGPEQLPKTDGDIAESA